MTDQTHVSQDLYETLKEIRDIIKKFEVPPFLDLKLPRIEDALLKYEKETGMHKTIDELIEMFDLEHQKIVRNEND